MHLFSQSRGRLRYDEQLGAFLPDGQLDGLTVAGSAAGVFTLAGCLADGHRGAREALTGAGIATGRPNVLPAGVAETPRRPEPLVLWRVPGVPAADGTTEFVDLQRDATVADIARAVGAGLSSIEHIKRYTTIGTAHDQGKTSGVIATGITAELLGVPVADTGTTTFRPPYTPVAFAALAGRDRGRMFDPERVTALHDWHVGPARCSRTSASGSGPVTTRSPARTWTPRCCANARRPAPASASWTAPPWARSTCRARTPRHSST